MNFRLGCRWSRPENRMSVIDHIELVPKIAMATANGAPSWPAIGPENENPGTKPPEPKCRHTGVSVASQVSHSRSQWSVWNEGSPSEVGASGNVMAREPLAATRSTSAAARSGSQLGTRDSG